MALREDQILRYSRQILLREVGGRGQEKLLAGGVRLKATGAAGLTAAAYVAAGGTSVEAGPGPLTPGAEGFLVSAERVGRPASEVLARALPDVNADALPGAWCGAAGGTSIGVGRRGPVGGAGRGRNAGRGRLPGR